MYLYIYEFYTYIHIFTIYIYIYTHTYIYMNWNWFTSPRICSWQEGDPGRTNILVGVQRQGKTNVPAQRQSSTSFPLLEGESAFLSSTDWMRPTHISEGNLLYLVYLVNLIENNLTEAPRIMFDQISGYLVAQ